MIGFRRAFGSVGLALFLTIGTAGVASAAVPTHAASCQPGVGSCPSTHGGGGSHTPGTTTKGKGSTRYCVSGYKPGSKVTITNPSTGKTTVVVVSSSGKACTGVGVTKGCQSITARGTGSRGTATSSSARVCDVTQAVGSSLPFTGSDLVVPGTEIGGALLLAGLALLGALRLRRRPVATA